jgi:hypothetical protein
MSMTQEVKEVVLEVVKVVEGGNLQRGLRLAI